MTEIIIEDLQLCISKLEDNMTMYSPEVVIKVKKDYATRVRQFLDSTDCSLGKSNLLKQLIDELFQILEEIELRISIGEFNMRDLHAEIDNNRKPSQQKELFKLFASLNKYKESIDKLANIGDDDQGLNPESQDEEDIDFLNLLTEFEQIDIFSPYNDGDETYDSRYETEDKQVLSEIFFHILDGYLDPLIVGFRSILNGNHSQKLFQALLASIKPLQRSAQKMGFSDLADTFSGLEQILNDAIQSKGLLPSDRVLFMRAFGRLASILPNEGRSMGLLDILDNDSISSSLMLTLIQSKSVKGWMIQALVEVGINTPARLLKTKAEEVKAVTGLPLDNCKALLRECRKVIRKQTLSART